jgi:hypothetical protein
MHLDGVTFTREQQAAEWQAMHAPYRERLNAALVNRAPGKATSGEPGR